MIQRPAYIAFRASNLVVWLLGVIVAIAVFSGLAYWFASVSLMSFSFTQATIASILTWLSGMLPDLLFETHPSVAVRPTPNPVAYAELNGVFPDHAREGILVCAGPSFAPETERGRADIADLAPTVLHLLGLPVYDEMSGRALTEFTALDRAVRSIGGVEHAAGRAGAFHGSTSENDEGVMQALEQLGYVERD